MRKNVKISKIDKKNRNKPFKNILKFLLKQLELFYIF